jgi:AraC family transcriptional regulator of adaptative response / DNA-3-methyladenine glycosylase II
MQGVAGLDRGALDRARVSRDARFDGKFFIAVTSTGIYCRPICPVPSPKLANIRYYATAAAAAEAGFRPCLRCRPEVAPGTPAWLGTSAVVRRALSLIQDGALDDASVAALALRVGVGPRHQHRLFVLHVGASPIAVAQTRRLHFAKQLLDETGLKITEIALAAGYRSVRRFNGAFHSAYGRAPRELRARRPEAAAVAAGDEVVMRLAYRPPYDWTHQLEFLAARAVPGVERADERGYARSVRTGGTHALVCVSPLPGQHALLLRVRGAEPKALFPLAAAARRSFDLAADPGAVARALGADPLLAPLVAQRPGLRVAGAWDPFECAVRAVLGQQVSVAAGRTFAARLVERAGTPITGGRDGLTHLFPSPAALAAADLAGIGLTRAREAALRSLALAVSAGAVDFAAPPEAVARSLMAVPGLGAWTAQYVALRALAEPDAFPASDLVLRRVAAGAKAPLTERALVARAEAWRPWRAYAASHLWRAAHESKAPARRRLA